jgi:hypothetical protein
MIGAQTILQNPQDGRKLSFILQRSIYFSLACEPLHFCATDEKIAPTYDQLI